MSGDQLFIIALLSQLIVLAVAILSYVQGVQARRISRFNNDILVDPKHGMEAVAKSVNGMKTELVFTTALAAKRGGELEGRDFEAAKHLPPQTLGDT